MFDNAGLYLVGLPLAGLFALLTLYAGYRTIKPMVGPVVSGTKATGRGVKAAAFYAWNAYNPSTMWILVACSFMIAAGATVGHGFETMARGGACYRSLAPVVVVKDGQKKEMYLVSKDEMSEGDEKQCVEEGTPKNKYCGVMIGGGVGLLITALIILNTLPASPPVRRY